MSKKINFHEALNDNLVLEKQTPRFFGIVMGCIFLILAKINFYSTITFCIAVCFFVAALFFESRLNLLLFYWQKIGQFLHQVMTPVILFIIFFLIFAPYGFLLRLIRKTPLLMSADPQKTSYWKNSELSDFTKPY